MKRTLAILLALAATVAAADLKLVWDNNPPSEQVSGYAIYQAAGPSTNWIRVATSATNAITLTNLPAGLYRFRITATNLWGESPPSAEAATPTVPSRPVNVYLQVYINQL